MEAIFYDDAVELLGVTPGTLYHAVTRKVLTRLPRKGQKQCLIKEQVLLFKGKRLSLAALSPQERKKWQEYAALAGQGQVVPSEQSSEQLQAIARQEVNNLKENILDEVRDEVRQDILGDLMEALGAIMKRPKSPALV